MFKINNRNNGKRCESLSTLFYHLYCNFEQSSQLSVSFFTVDFELFAGPANKNLFKVNKDETVVLVSSL